jgi:hypothetical protein
MADKSTFTADEWSLLRDAPQLVALAIATAGASGLVGTLKEAFSASVSLVQGVKSESALVREICSREEISAAQKALRAKLGELKGGDFSATRDRIGALAIDTLRSALDLLQRKGGPGDEPAYASFARGLAQRVAQAAKEGGFLGFGGERVSEGERQMLAKLDTALGSTARA